MLYWIGSPFDSSCPIVWRMKCTEDLRQLTSASIANDSEALTKHTYPHLLHGNSRTNKTRVPDANTLTTDRTGSMTAEARTWHDGTAEKAEVAARTNGATAISLIGSDAS